MFHLAAIKSSLEPVPTQYGTGLGTKASITGSKLAGFYRIQLYQCIPFWNVESRSRLRTLSESVCIYHVVQETQ